MRLGDMTLKFAARYLIGALLLDRVPGGRAEQALTPRTWGSVLYWTICVVRRIGTVRHLLERAPGSPRSGVELLGVSSGRGTVTG